MSTRILPMTSEFESEESAARHDKWFRAKVKASLDDPRPNVSHDQVMTEMSARLAAKREKRLNDC